MIQQRFNGYRISQSMLTSCFDNSIVDEESFMPYGHSEKIKSICFSPDEKYFATGSMDCTIKIWDTKNMSCISTLSEHSSSIANIAWSSDGKYLASISIDETIKIWNTLDFECIRTYYLRDDGDEDIIKTKNWRIWFTNDCKCLIAGFQNIKKLKINTETELHKAADFFVLDENSSIIDVHSTNNIVLIKKWNIEIRKKVIEVWNAETNKRLATHIEDDGDIWLAKINSEYNIVAVPFHSNHYVKLLDLNTLDTICLIRPNACKKISHMEFSADGKFLCFSSSNDLEIWSVESRMFMRHYKSFRPITAMSFGSRKGIVTICTENNAIDVYNIYGEYLGDIKGQSGYIKNIQYEPISNQIAVISNIKDIQIYNASDLSYVEQFGEKNSFSYVNYCVGQPLFLAITKNSKISTWNPYTFEQVKLIKHSMNKIRYSMLYFNDNIGIITGDSKILIVDTKEYNVILEYNDIELSSVKITRLFPKKKILIISTYSTIEVYSVNMKKKLTEFSIEGYIVDIICSPAENFFLVISEEFDKHSIILIDVSSLNIVKVLEHDSFVSSASFNSDGNLIVSSTQFSGVYLWNLKTGETIKKGFEYFDSGVTSALFVNHDKYILTGDSLSHLILWDTKDLKFIEGIRCFSGLIMVDASLNKLHPDSFITDETKEILRQYGAII